MNLARNLLNRFWAVEFYVKFYFRYPLLLSFGFNALPIALPVGCLGRDPQDLDFV